MIIKYFLLGIKVSAFIFCSAQAVEPGFSSPEGKYYSFKLEPSNRSTRKLETIFSSPEGTYYYFKLEPNNADLAVNPTPWNDVRNLDKIGTQVIPSKKVGMKKKPSTSSKRVPTNKKRSWNESNYDPFSLNPPKRQKRQESCDSAQSSLKHQTKYKMSIDFLCN